MTIPSHEQDTPQTVVPLGGGDGATQSLVVLYIEDHPVSVMVMKFILELRPAWRLVHAGTVAAGIIAARTHLPNLILLDMHLPDGTGDEALAVLKADRRTRDIPVVILSAGTTDSECATLLDAGAHQVWLKPHDLSLVLAYFDGVAATS